MDFKAFQALYKSRTLEFSMDKDVALTRRITANRLQRLSSRNNLMMEKRNICNGVISPYVTPCKPSVKVKQANNKTPAKALKENKQKEKLLKWQEEKRKRLEMEKKLKKPVFKVSHITHEVDLNKVYNEIKGKTISLKNIAPSKNYQFKPPINIRTIELKTSANAVDDKKEFSKTPRKVKTVKNENKTQRVTRQTTRAQTEKVLTTSLCQCKSRSCVHSSSSSSLNDKHNDKESENILKPSGKGPNKSKPKNTTLRSRRQLALKTVAPEKNEDPLNQPSTSGLQKIQNRESEKLNASTTTTATSDEEVNLRQKTPKRKSVNRKRVSNYKTQRPLRTPKPTVDTISSGSSDDVDAQKISEEKISSSLSTDYPLSEELNTSDTSSQPKTPVNKNEPSIYISPFVTLSRGKENARKEYKRRSEHGGCDENSTNSTSPKAAAKYFYRLLDNQIQRLQEICKEWNEYKEKNNPAEEVCDMIHVAVGQTELLINKKCQQFRELISMCETGRSEKPVVPLDLHGFWDMISIQIGNLDKRFENLQRLRDNDWEEILPEVKTTTQRAPKRVPKKTAKKGVSSVQAFIRERRRAATKNQNEEVCVVSETKTATPKTDRRVSALMSSNRRTSSPGLTMMKITQAAKSVTPKSILKSQKPQRKSMLDPKKVKAVLFKDEDCPESEKNNDQENDYNMLNITPPSYTPRRSKRLSTKNQLQI